MHTLTALVKLTSIITVFFILSLTTISSFSQPVPRTFQDDTGRLERIRSTLPFVHNMYEEFRKKNNSPAIAFGIMVDGILISWGNSGFANIENKTPATTKSAFRIASMSKSFTAMAIVKLRDRGKLRLDDPAHLYIPELKKLKYLTLDAPVITIRNLLTHSAGFPEDNPWGDRQLADTDKELLQLIEKGISFSNAPGITYEYSNLAFAMLGRIITKVSGKPYQQYINENILKPLGMNNTYWEYSKVPRDKLVKGYRWINSDWKEEELQHDGAYGAMGGMISSIEDFSKYMKFNMEAWPPSDVENKTVLKKSSVREMHQPWTFNTLNAAYKYASGRPCATASAYGYGLRWIKDCEGKTYVGHSGGLPGFGSNWNILSEYGIGVMLFSNVTYAPTSALNMQVLDTIVRLAKLKPREFPASAILEQRKVELVKLLPHWRGADASKIFAENFFPDYPIDGLKEKTLNAFEKAGKILSVSRMYAENNLRGYFMVGGEKFPLKISFTLTPENPPLIQSFDIEEVQQQ